VKKVKKEKKVSPPSGKKRKAPANDESDDEKPLVNNYVFNLLSNK